MRVTAPQVRLVLRVLFGAVGVAFLVIAMRDSWLKGEVDLPTRPVVVLGVVFLGCGVVAAGLSWAALFESVASRARLVASFVVSMVARYAPGGGISAAVGQISLSTSDGVSAPKAGARFLVHAGVQVVVAATLAGFLVFDDRQPGWVRAVAGLALLSPLLLTPRWMMPVVVKAARLVGRQPPTPRLLPNRRQMLVSACWIVIPTIAGTVVFAAVLRDLSPGSSTTRTILVFAAAWVVGYLAIPFPAGIGVREAVLVALLPGQAAVVVPASIIHRLLVMIAELIVVPVAWWRSR